MDPNKAAGLDERGKVEEAIWRSLRNALWEAEKLYPRDNTYRRISADALRHCLRALYQVEQATESKRGHRK